VSRSSSGEGEEIKMKSANSGGYELPLLGLALLALAAGCSRAPDPLAGLEPGETSRVVRVYDGDALVLDNGLTVRLAGIEAPAGQRRGDRPRPAEAFSKEARQALEDLTLGREVALFYGGSRRDRYGRALAHLRVTDETGRTLWVNGEMIAAGAARVRTWPDTIALNDTLLAMEGPAREGGLGLWGLPDYAVREVAEQARSPVWGFSVLRGKANGHAWRSGTCTLTFADGFVAAIERSDAIACAEWGQAGQLRFRGWQGREPAFDVSHPGLVEILPG
jgi:micrococcal nuclease